MRQRKRKTRASRSGFAEDAKSYEAGSDAATRMHQRVELGAGGRLVIPAPMRAALGMKVGDQLHARLEGDELHIYTYEAGIRRIQQRMRPYLPENAVDEFLRWKRQEAAKEWAELEAWSKDE